MPRHTIEDLAVDAAAEHGHESTIALIDAAAAGRCVRTTRRGLLRVIDGEWAEQWAPVGNDNPEAAVETARRLCAPCRAKGACLVLALREGTVRQGGVRGGTTEAEREAFLRAVKGIELGIGGWAVAA